MPGDVEGTRDPTPIPVFNSTIEADIARQCNALGFTAAPAEKWAWRGGVKSWRYCNTNLYWSGTSWGQGVLSGTKTTLAPTASATVGNKSSATPSLYLLSTADQVEIANSFYQANPATAWGADEHVFLGGVIMQWNGTSWVIMPNCNTPRIQEAATIPVYQGDFFYDPRVTGAASASSLLGYGYIPVMRPQWKTANAPCPTLNYMSILGSDPAGPIVGWQFSWDGTGWVFSSSGYANPTVAPAAVVTNTWIAGLPADQRAVGCSMAGYIGSPSTHWTTGQSATIGGCVVHWHGAGTYKYWFPGAAP